MDVEAGKGLVANRESLVKRVEMHVFQGQNVHGWIVRVERYFLMGGYRDESQLELVSVSLDEAALSWFNGELVQQSFTGWTDFNQRLIVCYTKGMIGDSSQLLFGITPNGSI